MRGPEEVMPAAGLAPVRAVTGLAGPVFRIGKLSWDNQQVRRELEVILGQALSRAISSAYEGVGEVQQAGARLAKRFRCVAPPGTDSGRLGRVTVWTKSRVPILRPPIPDTGSVQGAGWEEEQRRWAENALDDPEVVSELEAITKVIGQRSSHMR